MKFEDLIAVLKPHNPILFGKSAKNLGTAKVLQLSISRGARYPQKVRGVSSPKIHALLDQLPLHGCVTAFSEHSITLGVEFPINKNSLPSHLEVRITECTHSNLLNPDMDVRNHKWLEKNSKPVLICDCNLLKEKL
jgi:hypothetical protein